MSSRDSASSSWEARRFRDGREVDDDRAREGISDVAPFSTVGIGKVPASAPACAGSLRIPPSCLSSSSDEEGGEGLDAPRCPV